MRLNSEEFDILHHGLELYICGQDTSVADEAKAANLRSKLIKMSSLYTFDQELLDGIMTLVDIAEVHGDAEVQQLVMSVKEHLNDMICEWHPMDRFKSSNGETYQLVTYGSDSFGVIRESNGHMIHDATKTYKNADDYMATHWSQLVTKVETA